jgi:23S rRNA (adenine2030-N6)-methyltransferase
LNYRHAYHAGSFADVFKHVVLIALINSLLTKDKPFCYFDTHAGIGRYTLRSFEAQKTKEYETGIGKIIKIRDRKPAAIDQYLKFVRSINPTGVLEVYPGSPRIVRSLLRPDDKMILTELHPDDYLVLKKEFKQDPQVGVHHLDGYQGLKAFLPPKVRRGLVFIDPPFENSQEFEHIAKNLSLALQRWEQAIYAIWYPVKNRRVIDRFEQQLHRKHIHNCIHTELCLYPDDSPLALNGSGLLIVNPPWQFEEKLREILPWLLEKLDLEGRGHYRIEK